MTLSGTIENCENSASVAAVGGVGNAGGIVGAAYYTTPTGRMAARVLNGEDPATIPYEIITNSYLYVNPTALADYGLEVPAELSERAIDVTAEAAE